MTSVYKMRGMDALAVVYDTWLATGSPDLTGALYTGTLATPLRDIVVIDSWLAETQPPAAHKASHQDGGSDEINVNGLSGVLAGAQVANKIIEPSGPTILTVGAMADGQLIARSGSSLVGSTLFTSAGAWFPDLSPIVGHAHDEEFNGGSMPAGWAEWDVEGLLAVAFADGFCQLTNSPGGVGLRGIYRTCPPEAEWSIWSKVNLSGIAAAQFSCGIFVAEDIAVNPTTAKIAWALIAVTSVSATVLNRGTGTDYNGPFVNQVNLAYGPWGYVRIGYDGTNFTFWGSNSGLEWVSIGPVLAKTFTPSHAGICVLNISPGPAYHYIDFYRVKAGAGASGPGAGLFRGRRL